MCPTHPIEHHPPMRASGTSMGRGRSRTATIVAVIAKPAINLFVARETSLPSKK